MSPFASIMAGSPCTMSDLTTGITADCLTLYGFGFFVFVLVLGTVMIRSIANRVSHSGNMDAPEPGHAGSSSGSYGTGDLTSDSDFAGGDHGGWRDKTGKGPDYGEGSVERAEKQVNQGGLY